MALIHCPECNKEVSDSALQCPNCGFNLQNANKEFKKVIKPLSNKKKSGYGKATLGSIGGIILIAAGIPLITVGVGVIMIIVGIFGFFASMTDAKKHQYGECPYCNTELKVLVGNKSFKCPVCNNVGIQTESTLESTH